MSYFENLKKLIKYYKAKPLTETMDKDIKTIKYLEQLKNIYMAFGFDDVSINDKIFEIERNVSKLNVKDIDSKEIIKNIQAQLGLLLINHISGELNIEENE